VMVDGTLRCLGPIQTLKARYGQGWHVSMRLEPTANADTILTHLQESFVGVTLDELEPPLMEINVPQDVALSALFAKLESSRQLLKIKECSVTQTTLEQVFVKMAKQKVDGAGFAGAEPSAPALVQLVPPADLELVRTIIIRRAKGQKLGLDLADVNGKVLVEAVHAGYAAEQCGATIFERDVVSAVAGQPTTMLRRDDVYKLIGSIKSSEIELTLDSTAWMHPTKPGSPVAQTHTTASFEIEDPARGSQSRVGAATSTEV